MTSANDWRERICWAIAVAMLIVILLAAYERRGDR
jgi:hypothetical protein